MNQKLRESVGLDEDEEAELLAKKAETEAAQQKVFAAAKDKGVDPKLVDERIKTIRRLRTLRFGRPSEEVNVWYAPQCWEYDLGCKESRVR